MGHIHGAIVAATVGTIVVATITCSVYIHGAIVAATIAPIGCGGDRPVYTPCNCKSQSCLHFEVVFTVYFVSLSQSE